MDRDDRQSDKALVIDRDSQINVVVNSQDDDDSIDLGRVFHNAKKKSRVYAWVLLLCMAAGISGGLLLYQLTRKPTVVSSVVTLKYKVVNDNGQERELTDLTAPDGEGELDLNQITSSYVLQNALSGMELSHPVTLSNLRSNIQIDKILTEESRRKQEVAASMIEDKNNQAYNEVQSISMTYDNRFIVTLTNGFGDEGSKVKYDLTDTELRLLLDRILTAYNDYLVKTYADVKLPDDEISVIDVDGLDWLECLDQLTVAVDDLYEYCDGKSETVRGYRSWRTGRSMNDLMQDLRQAKDVNVNYLYAYVYADSIVKDRKTMLTNYQYQLRNAQTELDVVNEDITTTQSILDTYKNDEIYVTMQESDTSKSTQVTSDYFNSLVLQQAKNYEKAAELETLIAETQRKIDNINTIPERETIETVSEELTRAIDICHESYEQINDHMEEVIASHFYNNYAEHSSAQGKTQSFIKASLKQVIIGLVAGVLIACGLWFMSALAPEFRRKEHEDEERGKEAAES